MRSLPFATASFDAAYSSMVLHHLLRPVEAVRELAWAAATARFCRWISSRLLVYRSLRPEYRERIKHYVPFMSVFDPQRAYTADALPTVAPSGDDGPSAADLLLTPDDVIMPAGAGDQPATPTPNEDMVIIITATPSLAPTEVPTEMSPTATEVPVTDEPEAVVVEPTATPTLPPTPTSQPTAVALLPSARLMRMTISWPGSIASS